jgi:hypothetical protein
MQPYSACSSAAGGTRQIAAIQKEKPDVLICGELNEWETSEYIRDLRYMGLKPLLCFRSYS